MGGAFDILAKTLRKIGLISFANGFSMRNRPGLKIDKSDYLRTGLVDVKSMTECYYEQPSTEGINAYVVGRTGDGKKRNLHFMDISVDHRTEIGSDLGYVNGVFRVRVSRDGANDNLRDGLYVMDRETLSEGFPGTVVMAVGGGQFGQVRIGYIPDQSMDPNDMPWEIQVGSAGIRMLGLPTSPPSTAGCLWNSGGTLKIT